MGKNIFMSPWWELSSCASNGKELPGNFERTFGTVFEKRLGMAWGEMPKHLDSFTVNTMFSQCHNRWFTKTVPKPGFPSSSHNWWLLNLQFAIAGADWVCRSGGGGFGRVSEVVLHFFRQQRRLLKSERSKEGSDSYSLVSLFEKVKIWITTDLSWFIYALQYYILYLNSIPLH